MYALLNVCVCVSQLVTDAGLVCAAGKVVLCFNKKENRTEWNRTKKKGKEAGKQAWKTCKCAWAQKWNLISSRLNVL